MSACSKNVAAACIVIVLGHAFAGLHLEDVVRLDGVQCTLAVIADQFDGVLRFAAFVHDS